MLHYRTFNFKLQPTQANVDELIQMAQTLVDTGGYTNVDVFWQETGRIFKSLSVQVELSSFDQENLTKGWAYLEHCIS